MACGRNKQHERLSRLKRSPSQKKAALSIEVNQSLPSLTLKVLNVVCLV